MCSSYFFLVIYIFTYAYIASQSCFYLWTLITKNESHVFFTYLYGKLKCLHANLFMRTFSVKKSKKLKKRVFTREVEREE